MLSRLLPLGGALLLISMSVYAADSDGDGIDDDWELKYGMNPGDPADAALDTDKDGLTALEEFNAGTKPWDKDSDNDWLRDGVEVNTYGTDPNDTDTDDDQIFDFYEAFYGTDPLDPFSGPGDPDADGFDTIAEARLNSRPDDDTSVPAYQGNFSESFEQKYRPMHWYNPAVSAEDWRWNCSSLPAADGTCVYQAGRLDGGPGESRLGLQLYVQPGTLSFRLAWSTMGKVQVWVDGIRVWENQGWSIWNGPVELHFSAGLHEVEFVHLNDGFGGGIMALDDIEYREVTGIYGADATNRFCMDVQRFLASTDVTTYNKIEPDFQAFLESKVEPWPSLPNPNDPENPYEGNDSPYTIHQLTTMDPTDSYEQLISCKVKHWEGLNATVQAGLSSGPERSCKEVNQQTMDNVLAAMSPAELASIPTDGLGEPILPILDNDKGSFASEWVYDTAYTGTDGLTHIQAKRLQTTWNVPPGFEPPPSTRGVHYCHLIAPEYMRELILGGTPIDNAPAGRD